MRAFMLWTRVDATRELDTFCGKIVFSSDIMTRFLKDRKHALKIQSRTH
jgi:hypothetical protein